MYRTDGAARSHYLRYGDWLKHQPADRLAQKRAEADALFHRVGITFAVYGQEEGAERLIPFDIVPRVLPPEEWIRLESGLKQRVHALNSFIHDIYHEQQILKAGIVPAEQVLCNPQYRPEMQGVDVPGGIYAHIAGIDIVRDEAVFMRTTQGPQRVDVIYRRIDDDFLDPLVFRPDSMLGIPGLLTAYRAGHVTIANAIGTGVADGKSIYPYVPDMIRFYLGQAPMIGNVHTWMLRRQEDMEYVLAHLSELVVKEVHGAGGYGMLIGPAATKAEIEAFRKQILATPDRYIAQPTLALSTCPTFVNEGLSPRHIDLRPFVLSGRDITIVPGGLTRVALREGSLVVNSSQGGGTKDTWVLESQC